MEQNWGLFHEILWQAHRTELRFYLSGATGGYFTKNCLVLISDGILGFTSSGVALTEAESISLLIHSGGIKLHNFVRSWYCFCAASGFCVTGWVDHYDPQTQWVAHVQVAWGAGWARRAGRDVGWVLGCAAHRCPSCMCAGPRRN